MPVRGLTVLVVVMGILIIAGFTTLVVLIAGRLSHAPAPAAATAPRPFAAAAIEMPKGARIEAMGVGSDKAILDLVLPDGSRELMVIELGTGRQLGTIPLRSAP